MISGIASAEIAKFPRYDRDSNSGNGYHWTFGDAEATGVAYYINTFHPEWYGYTFPVYVGIRSSQPLYAGTDIVGYRNELVWETHDQNGQLIGGMHIYESECMQGYVYAAIDNQAVTQGCYSTTLPIVDPPRNAGVPASCPAGNPVNTGTGNKYQTETDIRFAGPGALEFTRTYNSYRVNTTSRIGALWMHNFEQVISYSNASATSSASALREDGKVLEFRSADGISWSPGDSDIHVNLERLFDIDGTTPIGWRLTDIDDSVELYDAAGRLTSITDIHGYTLNLAYNATTGLLETVAATTGEFLQFGYDAATGQIIAITDHTGRVWKYQYDTSYNRLRFVIYPDTAVPATPEDDTDNPRREYHYESSYLPYALTGLTDERGIRYATWFYDINTSRALVSTHADNAQRVQIAYNADGTRTVTNSRGIASTYSTATQSGVVLVTDIQGPGCATCGTGNTEYYYDPGNNNLLYKKENDVYTKYGDYDPDGNYRCRVEGITSQDTTDLTDPAVCAFDPAASPDARITTYTYDPRYTGRIATLTEPSVYAGGNRTTTYTYDDFGNRTSESISGFRPDGGAVSRTASMQYNGPFHQLSRIDGPRTDVSDITTLRYYADDPLEGDNRARLREIEDATGVLVRANIQYSATGMVASEDRPNGLSLVYSYYPGNDRLETLTESDGSTSRSTRWTWLATGEVESITTAYGSPDATSVTFGYDAARRLVRVTDGLGNYIRYTLDTEGNIEQEETFDANGTPQDELDDVLTRAIHRTFDTYNRLDLRKAGSDPNSPLESYDPFYDPDGTLSSAIDGNGKVTDYSYDALKRLLSGTQDQGGLNALTQYGYDTADRLTQVTDPNGGTTSYVYDDLGNLLSTGSPDTGLTTYSYDAAGNVMTRTGAAGTGEAVTLSYSYDALNRLTGVTTPEPQENITYAWDSCTNGSGRLCAVSHGAVTITYDYDSYGNITAHQGLGYTYDTANRLGTLTYPSGIVVAYHYDTAGQISGVDLTRDTQTTPLATGITHIPFGGIETLGYGNGQSLSRQWDSAGRLLAQDIPGILSLDYPDYDGNGNLQQRDDGTSVPTLISSFGYDALDRLDSATGPFSGQSLWDYSYDLNSNRTLSDEGAPVTLTYETDSNRLDAIGAEDVILDVAGNTLARGNWTYAYTPHNRLKEAFDTGTSVVTYAYNGLGQRVSKTLAGGTLTQYRYGPDGALLAELDDTGAPLKEYVYLDGQLLAVLATETVQTGGGEVIVDNGAASTTWTGTWATKTSGQSYGADYELATKNTTPSTYRWTPALTAGTYEVYAWWVSSSGYSDNVPYTVVHDGQTVVVYRSHKQDGGSWQLLGTYGFDGSGNEYIEVSNANGKATADAVRLVKQATPVTQTSLYYVHNDQLRTPRVMTDENGTVVWKATYHPFGAASVDEDPDGNAQPVTLNVRFPGQYYDQETGMHYNYLRYYDPSTGRYITSDPIGLGGGLNTYAYVNANPLRFMDQIGLCSCIAVTEVKAKDDIHEPHWWGHRRLVTCRYKCTGDDREPKYVDGTHSESHILKYIGDDEGDEGDCIGSIFKEEYEQGWNTGRFVKRRIGYESFDPRTPDDLGRHSEDLEKWAEVNCNCDK